MTVVWLPPLPLHASDLTSEAAIHFCATNYLEIVLEDLRLSSLVPGRLDVFGGTVQWTASDWERESASKQEDWARIRLDVMEAG